jgi:putative membrane protein
MKNTFEASQSDRSRLVTLGIRGAFGGVLMGLANLVPGISGGTMLLASGVYPQFISGVAEVTTFRFRVRTLLILACIIGAAMVAVVGLAGPVRDLVVHHRWIMYSLFIGLTLGGVPLLWRMIGRPTPGVYIGAAAGLGGMIALAAAQMLGGGSADRSGFGFMFLAGAAGAAAMILPGISGGYLLLVLGVYVPLLGAIADFKNALPVVGEYDAKTAFEIGGTVVLPVGLGVVVGVAMISNLLKWLLLRFEKTTLGVLLGLLLGAVVGIWPFQSGVEPQVGDVLKNQTVAKAENGSLIVAETGRDIGPEDWPTAFFRPSGGQVAGSVGLIIAGFAASWLVTRIGSGKGESRSAGETVSHAGTTAGADKRR